MLYMNIPLPFCEKTHFIIKSPKINNLRLFLNFAPIATFDVDLLFYRDVTVTHASDELI